MLGLVFFCRHAAAQPRQLAKWDYQATVINLIDPGGIFPDVQLGDPVHGTLKCNVNDDPTFVFDLLVAYYQPELGEVATMTLENPRSGGEFTFAVDPAYHFFPDFDFEVFIVNDDPSDNSDGVFFLQSVQAPAGFEFGNPVLEVDLFGHDDALSGASIPPTLALDDWPIATVAFYDSSGIDPFGTTIVAEIYSLTAAPLLPADFDANGDVNGRDLLVWQDEFGFGDASYGDADYDGDTDGADFLIWQQQFGAASPAAATIAVTPEPATLMLVALATALSVQRRRSAWQISNTR